MIGRLILIAASLTVPSLVTAQPQNSVQGMLDECRAFAVTVFQDAFEAISVKYEGQRTDGTHAVNGSVRNGSLTFQCSFERNGYRVEQLIVNNPNPG